MVLHPLVQPHLEGIRALAHRFGVERLEIFGSAVTTAFDPERSDVDFLVAYPDDYDFGPWLVRFQDLEEELAALLDREVDLVMVSALQNRWFNREATRTRMVIYDASEIIGVAEDAWRSSLSM